MLRVGLKNNDDELTTSRRQISALSRLKNVGAYGLLVVAAEVVLCVCIDILCFCFKCIIFNVITVIKPYVSVGMSVRSLAIPLLPSAQYIIRLLVFAL